jgi:hypothetical protein
MVLLRVLRLRERFEIRGVHAILPIASMMQILRQIPDQEFPDEPMRELRLTYAVALGDLDPSVATLRLAADPDPVSALDADTSDEIRRER